MISQEMLHASDIDYQYRLQDFIAHDLYEHVDHWENAGDHPRQLYSKGATLGLWHDAFDAMIHENDLRRVALLSHEISCQTSSALAVAFTATFPILYLLHQHRQHPFVNNILQNILVGKSVIALAITEPTAGSDIKALCTQAKVDNKLLWLNGKKTLICNGFHATHLLMTAMLDNELALILAEKPSTTLVHRLPTLGWKALPVTELVFNQTALENYQILAKGKAAKKLLYEVFTRERLNMGTIARAIANAAYQTTLSYAKERNTFGKTLIEHQSINHRLAQIKIKLALMDHYYHAIYHRYQKNSLSQIDIPMYKYAATNYASEIVDICFQIHAGKACISNNKIERFYRDVRILRIGGGTDEMMLEIVGGNIKSTS